MKDSLLQGIIFVLNLWSGLAFQTVDLKKNTPINAGDVDGKDPLKKEMATHSSILAWEIPWTEEPGGLQSLGSQRVQHDLVTKQP